mmetsp:Transcript_6266/g.17026  ORF Transcript_6266/g.17026 Transcript_6266/m.17026 type:complete len:217 (-) Transcript_6266:1234-1884(-)
MNHAVVGQDAGAKHRDAVHRQTTTGIFDHQQFIGDASDDDAWFGENIRGQNVLDEMSTENALEDFGPVLDHAVFSGEVRAELGERGIIRSEDGVSFSACECSDETIEAAYELDESVEVPIRGGYLQQVGMEPAGCEESVDAMDDGEISWRCKIKHPRQGSAAVVDCDAAHGIDGKREHLAVSGLESSAIRDHVDLQYSTIDNVREDKVLAMSDESR